MAIYATLDPRVKSGFEADVAKKSTDTTAFQTNTEDTHKPKSCW